MGGDLERVLIHGVDGGQVSDDKVEEGAALGYAAVVLAGGIDLGLGVDCLRDLGVDLSGRHFGRLERRQELHVVEDVSLGVGEHVENLVLEVLELLLPAGDLHDELVLLLLQLRPLVSHDLHQQLVLQALWCHCEIDHSHLYAHLGRVVRIWQFGRNVEAELRAVVDVGVAQADEQTSGLLEYLPPQHRLEGGVQCLLHVFKQHRVPHPDTVLQRAQVRRLGQFDDLDLVCFLFGTDPAVRLSLGVDHERPAPALGHNNAVFDRQGVGWEPLDVPLADDRGVALHALQRKGLVCWNLMLVARAHPFLHQSLAEG